MATPTKSSSPRKKVTRAKTATKRTTKAKTTTAKTTKAKAPIAKTAPVSAKTTVPSATLVQDKAVIAGPVLKKPELIDRVVETSGLKKKDVKPIVEAMLVELGKAIAKGEELNLPDFGKLKTNRSKELANGKVMICKIRQPKPVSPAGADAPDANASITNDLTKAAE
ncbi:HU family DNA-binding protein [Aestuariibius sp. HNIBRBA575]|uniref:HU family DNA-binding protein n=1 Tax=Aestuariibius sp. HNIBRBA575 TaxID=3233343 RepID=UPI0034A40EB5